MKFNNILAVDLMPEGASGMSILTAPRLTMLVFFFQPIAFGSWLPRIPDVQQALGLGPAGLALALLGLPAGTLLTLPFAGPLVGRIGARTAIVAGLALYALAVSLPAFAPNPLLLFFALMLCGSSISFTELGMNIEADKVEKASGRLLMNTAHGCWSLGIMTGSIAGSLLAWAGLVPHWAMLLMAALTLLIGPALASRLPDYGRDRDESNTRGQRVWSPPSWALLGICLFVFGVTMTEGAMADWSAVFLRDVLAAGSGQAGLGYAVFALAVAGGRLGGDWLKAQFGAVSVARGSVVLALAGLVLLTTAPGLPVALLGFAIVGLGASVGFPLAVTAAADLNSGPSSNNVATLSFIALLGFLVGPPLIGLLAEHIDLRVGLAALIPILLASLVLAGRLRVVPPAPAALAQGEA